MFNLRLQDYWDILRCRGDSCCHPEQSEGSIPVCHRPFPLGGSTGSKQTLNGLFYVYQPELFSPG